MKRISATFLLLGGLFAFGCGSPSDLDDDEPQIEIGSSARGVCNAATPCNATPIFGAPSTVPATMDPGEKQWVIATMLNSGTGVWDTATFRLYSQMTPRSFWGTPYENVNPPVNPGDQSQHPLFIRSPAVEGVYPFNYRMRDSSGAQFGTSFSTTITVQEQQRMWDCANAGPVPARLTAGENAAFTFTVMNSGTATWEGTSGLTRMCQVDGNQWGSTQCRNLTSGNVGPGGIASFTFTLSAPATPGFYPLRRQMKDQNTFGVQFFDDDVADACINIMVESTLCGNGALDSGEQCDDNNLGNGDGCSDQCTVEAGGSGRIVDLATQTADRSLLGGGPNRQLGNVVIAQLVGNNIPDVIVGENADVAPSTVAQSRATAGRVSVYDGNGFLAAADSTVPTGSVFNVIGADTNDHLGAASLGRIVVGDVTGDGINDLIISASAADGPMEMRIDCGEIYVIVGGAAGLTGTIDLRNPPAGVLGKTIYGPSTSALATILAVGNVGGDATPDLIIGVPGDDNVNGTDAGSVVVLYGGATFASGGTIDLATATVNARIIGPTAGEFLGQVGEVGDVFGTNSIDLAVSSPNHTILGRTSAGTAWIIRGPISGTRNLLTQFDVQIIGEGAFDDLGSSMAIGNVSGDGRADLVIGTRQQRNSSGVRVGAVDVWTGPLTGGSFDLGAGDMPDARMVGVDPDDNTGSSVAVGNYNNDTAGYADIAIGASQADGATNGIDRAGEFSIVLGGTNLTGAFDLSVIGDDVLKVYAGSSPASLGAHTLNLAFGDLNGDGMADVCAGSYRGGPVGGRIDCFQAQ